MTTPTFWIHDKAGQVSLLRMLADEVDAGRAFFKTAEMSCTAYEFVWSIQVLLDTRGQGPVLPPNVDAKARP